MITKDLVQLLKEGYMVTFFPVEEVHGQFKVRVTKAERKPGEVLLNNINFHEQYFPVDHLTDSYVKDLLAFMRQKVSNSKSLEEGPKSGPLFP